MKPLLQIRFSFNLFLDTFIVSWPSRCIQILVKKMEVVSKYWVGLLERKRSQVEAGQQQQQKEKPNAEDTAEQHLAAESENQQN